MATDRDRNGRARRSEALVLRDQRALQLRLEGHALADIAAELGCSVPTVHRAIRRALTETMPARAIQELRAEQLARLEGLWAALWPKAAEGNARAAEVALKVLERQAKLMGLDAPEVRTIEVVSRDAVVKAIQELEAQIIELGGELPPGDADWSDDEAP